MDSSQDVYVVSAVRTPIGRFGGAFKGIGPANLAAPAMRTALEKAQVDPANLDLVMFGHVLRGGHGQLVPRQAARKAGIPDHVDAMAVDMVCSSGMMSLITACAYIQSGMAELVLAGGMESMSTAGFALSSKARWGYKYVPGNLENVTDLLYRDGLSDPISDEAMGVQAEQLAKQTGVFRIELDEIAARSHSRAHQATQSGLFKAEITPVQTRKALVEEDEGIRPDTSAAKLTGLRPVFSDTGVLTAGNSSQISDGAAALVLTNRQALADYRLTPLARIKACSVAAGEWWRFIEAPVHAVGKALKQCNLQISDIDLFENNEAFALSTAVFERQLSVDADRINVHGGAIALGHPIGCSGARIVVTLLHALEARGHTMGLAALCHGTGGGTAMVLERC